MTGETIPRIGLGTWALTGTEGLAAMKSALALGYRHIDTAQSYGTEANAGQAVRESGLARGDVFVTTKITQRNLGRIAESIEESLGVMGLDHADLVLIHWPAQDDTPPVSAYIGELARAQDSGLTRLIGVSNFTRRHIDEAIAELGEGRLATNQVEQHVYLPNEVLEAHCRAHGIRLTAYKPLVANGASGDPVLNRIASAHGATANQVALAWLLARGSIVIPKSSSAERQAANLAAGDLVLTAGDIAAIDAIPTRRRTISPGMAPDWD